MLVNIIKETNFQIRIYWLLESLLTLEFLKAENKKKSPPNLLSCCTIQETKQKFENIFKKLAAFVMILKIVKVYVESVARTWNFFVFRLLEEEKW